MKVALVSPNPHNLREMAATFAGLSHQVVTAEGGKTRMRALAREAAPDLMLVEGMCCDTGELALVEATAAEHPEMAIVLLCPTHTPEFLLQSMRAGVKDVMPSPATPEALAALATRMEARQKGGTPRPGGKVVAFMSCKGGSGATFLATNTGWLLAASASVLLVDLNLQFGDALAALHDGKPPSTIADVAQAGSRLDATLLAASTVTVAPNFSVLAAPEDASQSVGIKPEHVDAILALAATQYDFVLLDVARSIDPLTVRALDRANRIFAVLQQGVPAVRNMRQLLSSFAALGYPIDKTEVVVNRFDRSADVGLEDLRRTLGQVALRTVPGAWREVHAAIDHGTPLVSTHRNLAVTRAVGEMAATLQARPAPSRGFLDRLLKRA